MLTILQGRTRTRAGTLGIGFRRLFLAVGGTRIYHTTREYSMLKLSDHLTKRIKHRGKKVWDCSVAENAPEVSFDDVMGGSGSRGMADLTSKIVSYFLSVRGHVLMR